MSTFATADLTSSDEEADGDFVPKEFKSKSKSKVKVKGNDSGVKRSRSSSSSSTSSSDSEDSAINEGQGSCSKEQLKRNDEVEAEERKLRAAEAFRAMQAEVRSGGPKATLEQPTATATIEKVEITRPRRFAGETIYETVLLPADDPEVIAYKEQQRLLGSTMSSEIAPENSSASDIGKSGSSQVEETTASPSAPLATVARPLMRGPIRKKARQSLEAMSAALDKGKKMTTLEKSQIDWKSHMASDGMVADEIAQHRRSGGYLEKQEFLDRVEERRSGAERSNAKRR